MPNARTGCCRETAITSEGERYWRVRDIPQKKIAIQTRLKHDAKPCYYTVPQRIMYHGRFKPINVSRIGAFLPRSRIMLSACSENSNLAYPRSKSGRERERGVMDNCPFRLRQVPKILLYPSTLLQRNNSIPIVSSNIPGLPGGGHTDARPWNW